MSDASELCAICLETPLGRPKPLPCGHLFCPWCLVRHEKAQRRVKCVPSCPLCRSTLGAGATCLPPPPLCTGCDLGELMFEGPYSKTRWNHRLFTCDVCSQPITEAERWLRCFICDWDACNSCCARLGPDGVASVQRAHAITRRRCESVAARRSLWRRALHAVIARVRLTRSPRVESAVAATVEESSAQAEQAGDTGAAYNVYSLFDRSAQLERDAGALQRERLRQFYRTGPRRTPIHYISLELPNARPR